MIPRNILLLFSIALTLTSAAQTESLSVNYKPCFTFFGKQSQDFTKSYEITSRQGNLTFSNSVNILYARTISKLLTFSAGVEYSQQGQDIHLTTNDGRSADRSILKIHLNYLRIPLTIYYPIFKIHGVKMAIYSSISVGIVTKRTDNFADLIDEAIGLPSSKKSYKTTDLAIPIGINFKRSITRKLFVNFGGEYLIGLTNAFTRYGGSDFGAEREFKNSRQNRLGLNFGFGLELSERNHHSAYVKN